MKVLIFDFETMDDKPQTTIFTEIGARLCEVNTQDRLEFYRWDDMPHDIRPPVRPTNHINEFSYEPEYPPLTEFITLITGITDDMLKEKGIPRKVILEKLLPLVKACDVMISHKTAFDLTILVETAKRFEMTELVEEIAKKEIICSLTNVLWPKHLTCHKMGHLAWELGLPIEAADLHRALNDVDCLIQILNLRPFSEILEYARIPWVYLKADLLKPWGKTEEHGKIQSATAKQLGFAYQSVKGMDFPVWLNTWVTRVKAGFGHEERIRLAVANSDSPFRVSVIEGISK